MFAANESGLDRIIRIVLGLVMLALGWFNVVEGGWGTFLQWFGFVPLITGLLGWCAIYALLGIRTNGAAQPARR